MRILRWLNAMSMGFVVHYEGECSFIFVVY